MYFPTREFLKLINKSDLDKRVVSFLTYQLPNLERKWKAQFYKYEAVAVPDDIVDFMNNSPRVMNLMNKNREVSKTALILAFRADASCSEKSARKTVEDAIALGKLIENIDGRTKRIRICKSEELKD